MATVTIYHNPKCSKSRQTLALIESNGVKPKIIEYLKTPPNKTELKTLLSLLQLAPRDLLRTKEAEYTELGLANPSLSTAQVIELMVAHPKLIERPIVTNGKKAIIGRPPENVLELL